MTVGHFTIETSGSTDEAYLNAYDNTCHALLDLLRERIPPWKKSPPNSAVTLRKGRAYYSFKFSTPMNSEEIKAIINEAEKLEQFHILKPPNNISLVP